MSASLSLASFFGRRAWPAERGLDPELLLAEGILGDPRRPDHALRRARALSERGHYGGVRELLSPHLRSAPEDLRPAIAEQLAMAALHTGSGDLDELLRLAFLGFEGARDLRGLARLQRLRGDAFAHTGQLDDADAAYDEAAHTFAHLGDVPRQTLVLGRRARLMGLLGDLPRANARLDQALALLRPTPHPRAEGLLHLERAGVLAQRGKAAETAKDLISAERFLSTSPGRIDGLRTRIARAEALVLFGELERGVAGLRRLLAETLHDDDIVMAAHVERLLGEGLAGSAPSRARAHLARARHTYENAGATWWVVRCEIELGHVERRLGLNPQARARAAVQAGPDIAAREVIAHELNILRAYGLAAHAVDEARTLLLEARAHAERKDNRRLLRRVDRVLHESGLVSCDAASLDDEDTLPDGPLVTTGTASLVSDGGLSPATRRGPLPYEDDEESPAGALQPIDLRARN